MTTIDELFKNMCKLHSQGYSCYSQIEKDGYVIDIYSKDSENEYYSEEHQESKGLSCEQKLNMTLNEIIKHEDLGRNYVDLTCHFPGDNCDTEKPVWWLCMSNEEKKQYLDKELEIYYK